MRNDQQAKASDESAAASRLKLISKARLRARQRDLLHRHQAIDTFDDVAATQFDRDVLEVLAHSVGAEAAIFSEFQKIANQAVARSIAVNALPGRPNKRPNERVLDDARKRAAVALFLCRREQGGTAEGVAAAVGEQVGADGKTIQRWAKKAAIEAGSPSVDTASVTPEQVAADMGLNLALLPSSGTQWALHVIEHGPASRIADAPSDSCPWVSYDDSADL